MQTLRPRFDASGLFGRSSEQRQGKEEVAEGIGSVNVWMAGA